MREAKSERRYCGNCGSHNAYDYPHRVFCGKRLSEDKDPVVSTLWCCDEWNPASQECFCIKEAMKKQK
ncbi:hypothetical protein MUP01_04495 [Candidatus Bathyarchaeota archaeon]|nr:hypothetical protein [Candidatus Bathyarchaeota archaeon]